MKLIKPPDNLIINSMKLIFEGAMKPPKSKVFKLALDVNHEFMALYIMNYRITKKDKAHFEALRARAIKTIPGCRKWLDKKGAYDSKR